MDKATLHSEIARIRLRIESRKHREKLSVEERVEFLRAYWTRTIGYDPLSGLSGQDYLDELYRQLKPHLEANGIDPEAPKNKGDRGQP